MTVIYEDNHIIVVNKTASEIVQGDKTGDTPLSETVKQYLKDKYQKPGNVFIGVTHRLDRPVSGLVIFAKTSKALSRLNADAQFAGSSSVPAHVEMMGLIGMGNNPMVGATVAVAVSVEEAAKAGKF